MTPSDARKNSNEMDVKLQLLSHRKHNRQYPLLEKGDKVKTYRKNKLGEKERTSTWSENSYELEGISKSHDQHFLKLNGLSRQYMRHELLKVWHHNINLLFIFYNRLYDNLSNTLY